MAGSLLAHPKFGPLPELLLALTLVTGLVDAVSILALGRVFVANMTGNVVFAGFAMAGAPGFSLSASLFALAASWRRGRSAGAVARTGHDGPAAAGGGGGRTRARRRPRWCSRELSGAAGASHGTRE